MISGIVPFIVTRNIKLIRLKQVLCVLMALVALSATVMKSLVMIKIDGRPIWPLIDQSQ